LAKEVEILLVLQKLMGKMGQLGRKECFDIPARKNITVFFAFEPV
jgi:hypothetical protein